MALTEKDTELIEEYLLGKLNSEEVKKVEERIKHDAEFAEEVTFMSDVILATREKGREELEKILSDAGNEDITNPEEQSKQEKEREAGPPGKKLLDFRRNWIYYVAVLILLLAVGIYINRHNSTRRLYKKYFSPHPNTLISYTHKETVPQKFNRFSVQEYNLIVSGMKHYDEENYGKTADLLEQNIKRNPENAGLIFYMAISQMETDQTEKAIDNLTYLKKLEQPLYHEHISWYLALAYLKNNQSQKADALLEDIRNISNHPHQKDAGNLLQKLK